MKTIIMYYTLGGTSKKEAERIASENENVVICEVQQKKKYNIFMCSGGGEAPKSEEGTKKMIQDKNCKLIAYHNIKVSK